MNVHDSSAGLSGGQRQKLVIFCLAAALRYQLAEDEDELPSYATIILDEAFDKADSRYTKMAMEVFVEFGFHMILATPEKLLQTIEPFVGGITSITNETRKDSRTAAVIFRNAESVPPTDTDTDTDSDSDTDIDTDINGNDDIPRPDSHTDTATGTA